MLGDWAWYIGLRVHGFVDPVSCNLGELEARPASPRKSKFLWQIRLPPSVRMYSFCLPGCTVRIALFLVEVVVA